MSDQRLAFGTDHCRCSACGEYFNSTFAFDSHRLGNPDVRRCLSVDEMRERGFSVNAKSLWVTKTRELEGTISTDPLPTQGVAA